jgi:hypothetical protein
MAFAPHPTESVDRMGQFGAPELSSAGNLLQALPEQWQNLLNHPEGAKSLIFAVLISESEALRNQELEILAKNVDPEALQLVKLLHPQFVEVSSAVLIATLDLAIPALRRMTPQEYDKFSDTLQLLISSDFEIDLFEFMIQKMLRRHLDLYFRLAADPKPIFHKPAQIIAPARIVISLLSTLAGRSETDRRAAFMEGSRSFSRFGVNLGDPMGDIGLAHLDEALNQLNKADFRIKQQFLQACGRTIMADGIVSDHEAEMVRAIADSIGCPLPPFAHSLVA